MSEISFLSSAQMGDLVELGLDAYEFGRTSIVLRCQARNMVTGKPIVSIEKIVMVGLDEHGRPLEHGYHEPTDSYERIPERQVLAEATAVRAGRRRRSKALGLAGASAASHTRGILRGMPVRTERSERWVRGVRRRHRGGRQSLATAVLGGAASGPALCVRPVRRAHGPAAPRASGRPPTRGSSGRWVRSRSGSTSRSASRSCPPPRGPGTPPSWPTWSS